MCLFLSFSLFLFVMLERHRCRCLWIPSHRIYGQKKRLRLRCCSHCHCPCTLKARQNHPKNWEKLREPPCNVLVTIILNLTSIYPTISGIGMDHIPHVLPWHFRQYHAFKITTDSNRYGCSSALEHRIQREQWTSALEFALPRKCWVDPRRTLNCDTSVSSALLIQWAAARITFLLMIEPPQKWTFATRTPSRMATFKSMA